MKVSTKMKRFFLSLLLLLSFSTQALAFKSFVIHKIRFEGLAHISRGTALNALPIKAGDTLTSKETAQIIHNLYDTNFFNTVALRQAGNDLVVVVTERPTIAAVNISGNDVIPTEKLKEALKAQGLTSGKLLNPSLLDSIQNGLIEQYYAIGKYNARVDVSTASASRNRRLVNVSISEGKTAKISKIQLLGNHTFSEKELAKQFILTTPGLMTLFTQNDQYSQEKLQASIEALRTYYLNRGFIRFEILSSQVALTPDRKHVYITVSIKEGQQYRYGSHKVVGQKVLSQQDLKTLLPFSEGAIFSRKTVIAAEKSLHDALGNRGYAYPSIQAVPSVNDKTLRVNLTFEVHPGHLTYVRRVTFSGNTQTQDVVLRREMRQMEGGLVNSKNVKASVRRLNLLGYFKNVAMKMQPVPNSQDEVDLNFHVKEVPSSQATFGLGYSTLDGFLIQAALAQPNFLGSGKALNVNFSNSFKSRSYSVSYTNPFYTVNGVSRSFNFLFQSSDPSRVNIANYTMDRFGGSMGYGIPLSENNRLSFNMGLQHQHLQETSGSSTQVVDFINENDKIFQQFTTGIGWSYNGYDKVPFTTKGFRQSLSGTFTGPLNQQSLRYYRLNYIAHGFYPLYKSFIGSLQMSAGYGNGAFGTKMLPFFENFYAGGMGSVRGYQGYSLGPKDSNNDSLGGDLMLTGSAELFFPNPVDNDALRTGLFVDTGNVYQTESGYGIGATGVDLGDMRYSTGLDVEWRSPFGILQLSLAKALNPKANDRTEFFAFNIGTMF